MSTDSGFFGRTSDVSVHTALTTLIKPWFLYTSVKAKCRNRQHFWCSCANPGSDLITEREKTRTCWKIVQCCHVWLACVIMRSTSILLFIVHISQSICYLILATLRKCAAHAIYRNVFPRTSAEIEGWFIHPVYEQYSWNQLTHRDGGTSGVECQYLVRSFSMQQRWTFWIVVRLITPAAPWFDAPNDSIF